MATSDEFTDALLLLRKWKEDGTDLLWQANLFDPDSHLISSRSERAPIVYLGDYSGGFVSLSNDRWKWAIRPREIQEVGDCFLRWSIKTGSGNIMDHLVRVPREGES